MKFQTICRFRGAWEILEVSGDKSCHAGWIHLNNRAFWDNTCMLYTAQYCTGQREQYDHMDEAQAVIESKYIEYNKTIGNIT